MWRRRLRRAPLEAQHHLQGPLPQLREHRPPNRPDHPPWNLEAVGGSLQLRHDHPGISAGVGWCAQELFGGRVARRIDSKRPHTGYAVALAKLRQTGVGPDDLLARWIAAYALQSWDENSLRRHRTFASDSYFRHQAAKLFLAPVTIAAPKWARGGNGGDEEDQDEAAIVRGRAGPLVREFTFERVNAALGVLALNAGREIVRRLLTRSSTSGDLPEAQRVPDDTAPFHPTNN
jgi:hypothetical protein